MVGANKRATDRVKRLAVAVLAATSLATLAFYGGVAAGREGGSGSGSRTPRSAAPAAANASVFV